MPTRSVSLRNAKEPLGSLSPAERSARQASGAALPAVVSNYFNQKDPHILWAVVSEINELYEYTSRQSCLEEGVERSSKYPDLYNYSSTHFSVLLYHHNISPAIEFQICLRLLVQVCTTLLYNVQVVNGNLL